MVWVEAGVRSGQFVETFLAIEGLVYPEDVLHHEEPFEGKMVERVVIGDQDLGAFTCGLYIFDLNFGVLLIVRVMY
jgi:hypothetical protein